MKTKMISVLIALIYSLTTTAQGGQSNVSDSAGLVFKTAGGIIGFGKAINTDTRYEPIYFSAEFSWSFRKRPRKNVFLAWHFEPQFNLVHTPRPLDIEFGANLGLRNYIRINQNFLLYQMLGSGPHYISAVVKRQ